MTVHIGINGFGRTGRQVYKAIRRYYNDQINVVAINDMAPSERVRAGADCRA